MCGGFSETFAVRHGREWLNGRPGGPLGTLAATVLLRSRNVRIEFTNGRVSFETFSAEGEEDSQTDLDRLRGAGVVQMWTPERTRECQRNLPAVRVRVEALAAAYCAASHRAPVHPIARWLTSDLARKMTRFEGVSDDTMLFRATPAGLVALSGAFGLVRGGLRVCKDCGTFVVFPWQQRRRRFCDDCQAFRTAQPQGTRATHLAMQKRARWRLALDRMRKRGFRRLGLDSPDAQEVWKRKALAALHAAKTEPELRSWEQVYAPKGKPGRPRKRAVTQVSSSPATMHSAQPQQVRRWRLDLKRGNGHFVLGGEKR
jgi:hypothetical protein